MPPLFLCNDHIVKYLFIAPDVPALVYYSHIPLLLICFSIFLLVIIKKDKGLADYVLLIMMVPFGFWVFFSLIFWTSNRSDVIMTIWALTLLIEPIIYIGSLYLTKILINEYDISLKEKAIIGLLYLPIILLLPSKFTLSGFDLNTCLSIEGPVALYYTYFIELIYTVLVIIFIIRKLINNNKISRVKVIYIGLGIILFLLSFSWGNMIGSFTNNWKLGEFGLLGMPIFISFLLYTTVKFNFFNLRLISRNLLVFTLWILIGSLITISDIGISHILIAITFIISLALGITLIKIGKREQKNLERIQSLAESLNLLNSSLSTQVAKQTEEIQKAYELEKKARRDLEKLNETKDKFISITQHNLRIPITNISNRIEKILSTSSKNLGPEARKNLEGASISINHLTDIADDFKNIAKMKVGSQFLNLTLTNVGVLIEDILQELKIDIENMNLYVYHSVDDINLPYIKIDSNKIREALLIILENAVRYNIKDGSIRIVTENKEEGLKIIIENTGVGITAEEKNNLFEKTFYRSVRVRETNPTGMGIGLSISKSIIEAHHGKITIDSTGENMGAKVIVELPFDFLKGLIK